MYFLVDKNNVNEEFWGTDYDAAVFVCEGHSKSYLCYYELMFPD